MRPSESLGESSISGSKREPFNPLEKRHLAESVAEALLSSRCEPLPPEEAFLGAGIYAIYYSGTFRPYQRVAKLNGAGKCRSPIYVGKAVPAGSRKGGLGLGAVPGSVAAPRSFCRDSRSSFSRR